MAYAATPCAVMAYTVMAYIVMAYIVMVFIFMAQPHTATNNHAYTSICLRACACV